MRSALVAALIAYVEHPRRARMRRFLRGLAYDELQFIAGYLGAQILESVCSGDGKEPGIQRRSEDHELKMILLVEYLGLAGRNSRTADVSRQARFEYTSTDLPRRSN